jgi:hypothetical protein
MNYVSLALKAAPYVAIALLIGVVLYMRTDLANANAASAAYKSQAEQLAAINADNAKQLADANAARVANDAIVSDLNNQLAALRTNNAAAQATARKVIANDPASHVWAATAVPVGLLDTVNASSH